MFKLLRELLLLIVFLIVSIMALLINLSFNFDQASDENIENTIDANQKVSKPIQNRLGKRLFKNNCAACHNRNMQDGLIGPALGGARERWENNDVEIYDFIHNSQKVIQGGNKYAMDLFQQWDLGQMPSFTSLERNEIDSILNYIDEVYEP